MMKKPAKLKFEVKDNETIDQCLERMRIEGYMPIRRIEEPIFKEFEQNGEVVVEPCGRRIVFEGKLQ
ncbi:NETI motif-containing protein [Fredinandcohnia humi]